MARAKLEEYTLNIGGVDHTVQLTPEDAELQGARKGRAEVDKSPTTPSTAEALTSSAEFERAVAAEVAKQLAAVTDSAPAATAKVTK